MHRNDAAAERRQQSKFRRTHDAAGFEHAVAGADVLSRVAHVLAHFGRHVNFDAPAICTRVFLAHHRVGAGRHRSAGEDARRRAR